MHWVLLLLGSIAWHMCIGAAVHLLACMPAACYMLPVFVAVGVYIVHAQCGYIVASSVQMTHTACAFCCTIAALILLFPAPIIPFFI